VVRTASVGAAVIEYVEVTLDDIALANRLAHEVLGRSLDELPPQTRRVLGAIVALVAPRTREPALARAGVRFTRRELRAVAGITDTALRVHLERLIEMEYVAAHRAGQGQRTVYELLFDGDTTAAEAQMVGLRDVAALESVGTAAHFTPPASDFTPPAQNFAPTSHPENTPFTPTSHPSEVEENDTKIAAPSTLVAAVAETAHLVEKTQRRRSRSGVSSELR
jgi:DNA primase